MDNNEKIDRRKFNGGKGRVGRKPISEKPLVSITIEFTAEQAEKLRAVKGYAKVLRALVDAHFTSLQ
jgi:hypothetical protein